MIIVSGCLAGINCNYKGDPICPEQLGGLPTPRTPAEIKEGNVFTKNGVDVTPNFVNGAKEVLKIAKMSNCKFAILKAKSPSCGSGQIYDGTFTEKLISGDGILTKELKQNGIKVFTEKEIETNLKEILEATK
ncbi:MAG: DUF523 domain-containing protein [Candidatus Diapherotrites archaeon]|nr:DUF523 domain-containing protein [Candidatus Diapherotrites archaeon]